MHLKLTCLIYIHIDHKSNDTFETSEDVLEKDITATKVDNNLDLDEISFNDIFEVHEDVLEEDESGGAHVNTRTTHKQLNESGCLLAILN